MRVCARVRVRVRVRACIRKKERERERMETCRFLAVMAVVIVLGLAQDVLAAEAPIYKREGSTRVVPYREDFYIELPPMKPGEVLFSIPQTPQMFMPMPSLAAQGKQVAVVNMHNVIVEAYNTSFVLNDAKDNWDEADMREVPLSQLYNHHWIAVREPSHTYSPALNRYRLFSMRESRRWWEKHELEKIAQEPSSLSSDVCLYVPSVSVVTFDCSQRTLTHRSTSLCLDTPATKACTVTCSLRKTRASRMDPVRA